MNILGMGTLELVAVLLVAFIFLGPERMVDAARLLGKASRELRRLTDELPDLVLDEERPIIHRGSGPNPSVGGPTTDRESEGGDGPVAFEPSEAPKPKDEAEEPESSPDREG